MITKVTKLTSEIRSDRDNLIYRIIYRMIIKINYISLPINQKRKSQGKEKEVLKIRQEVWIRTVSLREVIKHHVRGIHIEI